MKKASRKAVEKRAQELGLEIEIDANSLYPCIFAWSPKGYVFAANGCHTIQAGYAGRGFPVGELYAEMFEDLSHGLEVCETQGCDVCDPYEE